MRRRFKRNYTLLIFLSLVLGIVGLYFRFQSHRKDIEVGVEGNLTRLNSLNSSLNQNVLGTRLRRLSDYDAVSRNISDIRYLLEKLEKDRVESGRGSVTFRKAIQNYSIAFESKAALVEEFKAKNSIIRNSVSYLPVLTKEFSDQLTRWTHGRAASDQVLEVSNLILSERLGLDQDLKYTRAIWTTLETLKAKKDNFPKNIRAICEMYLSHAGAVLSNLPRLHELTTLILSDSEILNGSELEQAFRIRREELEQEMGLFFGIVVLFSLGTLIYLVRVLFKLWDATNNLEDMNQTLEERVRERTHELELSTFMVAEQQKQIIHASKLSAIGEMAGGIAHEINNPVSIILGRISELRDQVHSRDGANILDADDNIDKIEATLWRVTKIIRGLRSFSRETAGEPFEQRSIATLVSETMDLCHEKFKKNGITLYIDSIPSDAKILCQPTQITQVLLNLLNNAYDALETIEDKKISIEFRESSQEYELSIVDNGPGISSATREKLFQPFFTTKDHGKGTGLGLSISKGIIEAHRGQISVESVPKLTKFICRFPKALSEAANEATKVSAL